MAEPIELDLKDKKILFELDKNSRLSFPQIGKKVGLSQEVVYHRVNKLQKLGIIRRFQTVAAISKLGYIAPKVYVQFQSIKEGEANKIYKYLLEQKKVFWFGVCQGRWDLIIAYWSRDSFEFGKLLDEFMNKFSEYILEREITFGKNTIQYNRRWFYHDRLEPKEVQFGETLENNPLDDTDMEILKYLGDNARLSIVELAKLTRKSTNVVHYRIREMEKKKVIAGYKFALDAHKIGYETCKSFIYFKNITEERKKQLISFCKMHLNIVNIVICVGPWDMEIEFEVKNFDQFYDIMNEIKEKFSDIIKNYESVVFKEEPKQSFVPECYPQIIKAESKK